MAAKVCKYNYRTACKNELALFKISETFDDMTIVNKMAEILSEHKSKVSEYEVIDNEDSI
ncbi:hypothetical protein HMPREF1981_00023 [Bacteroides pyogenes F0041]|uniref:Uncharacterized protein n=1 Tax=Bacteroides pyogenes F0041 TaxID=1321819 RepID=U2E533_9BACE|nr:hypothetical protein HMPREF1981_00023 [Bacteroides pyogenes F0041]